MIRSGDDRLLRTQEGLLPTEGSQRVGRGWEKLIMSKFGLEEFEHEGYSYISSTGRWCGRNDKIFWRVGAAKKLLLQTGIAIAPRSYSSDHAGVLAWVKSKERRQIPRFPETGVWHKGFGSRVMRAVKESVTYHRYAGEIPDGADKSDVIAYVRKAWTVFMVWVLACWEAAGICQNEGVWLGAEGRIQGLLQISSLLIRGPKNSSAKERKRWEDRIVEQRGKLGLTQDEVYIEIEFATGQVHISWDPDALDQHIEAVHKQMLEEEERLVAEEERRGCVDMPFDRNRLNRRKDEMVLGKGKGYGGLEDENGNELVTGEEVTAAVDRVWSGEAKDKGGAEGVEEDILWDKFVKGYDGKFFPEEAVSKSLGRRHSSIWRG